MKKQKTSWQLWELRYFIAELQHLLSAGLPLISTLMLMQENLIGEKEILLAKQLRSKLEKGASFATAWFELTQETLSTALLSAGEASGLLVEMLKHIEIYANAQQALRRMIWEAIRYPLFLLALTVALLSSLCQWVVPQFALLYENFKVSLPFLTRGIISFSAAIDEHFFAIILTFVFGVFLSWMAKKQKNIKRFLNRLKQKNPFYRRIQALRLWHATTLLLEAGIPLAQALTICKNILDDEQVQAQIDYFVRQLQQGMKPSVALKKQNYFSKKLISILALAEVSGQMDTLLRAHVLAETQSMQSKFQSIKTWLEPIFLCVIGSVVGVVLVALYLPMVELGKAI